MSQAIDIPQRPRRTFLPEEFKVTTWGELKPYFEKLLGRAIHSTSELKEWLRHRSELESVISEESGWRYIRMTCYTDKQEYTN
ncbi:MAG: M3 family oligoendopeptidase, partial [Bacteroidota bacterium]